MSNDEKSKNPRRRQIIKVTAALSTLLSTGVPGELLAQAESSKKPKQLKIQRQSITIEEFLKVSRYLTGSDDLSSDVGRLILATLLLDKQADKKLRLLVDAYSDFTLKREAIHLNPTEFVLAHGALRDIIQEIQKSWYLGMRRVNEIPVFFTYFDALIFKATASFRGVPGICGGGGSFWKEKPQGT